MENKPGDILNNMSPQVYTINLPDDADTITADMARLPEGFEGRIVIPEGVEGIESGCFEGKPITSVGFPKSLRWIGRAAFDKCRLRELRVEGDGGRINIHSYAFSHNPELAAITLGNCELSYDIFQGCPVSRITLTGECIIEEGDDTLGFGGCINPYNDNFFRTVSFVYGGALGTYTLKGKLALTNYINPWGDPVRCEKTCGNNRCYTLAGFEDEYDEDETPEEQEIEWEMVCEGSVAPADEIAAEVGNAYTLALPYGAVGVTRKMVKLPEGFTGRVVIPEGVRRIEGGCFEGKPITAVCFPKSLREIGTEAFKECRLAELRVEGEGGKISIGICAFQGNPELMAVTLGNCELERWVFVGCPVSRVTLTGECIPPENDNTFQFGGCGNSCSDNFFGTVSRVYGGALGTYILIGELAGTNYKPDSNFWGCAEECGDKRCYTLAGFENDRRKAQVFEWEKVE